MVTILETKVQQNGDNPTAKVPIIHISPRRAKGTGSVYRNGNIWYAQLRVANRTIRTTATTKRNAVQQLVGMVEAVNVLVPPTSVPIKKETDFSGKGFIFKPTLKEPAFSPAPPPSTGLDWFNKFVNFLSMDASDTIRKLIYGKK